MNYSEYFDACTADLEAEQKDIETRIRALKTDDYEYHTLSARREEIADTLEDTFLGNLR